MKLLASFRNNFEAFVSIKFLFKTDLVIQMIFISAKYCHKGDCYLRDGTSTDILYNATVTRCESLGFKLSKITSREEHLFVMKVLHVSTRDSSVPSIFTGIFILTSILCNQELFLLCFRVIHSEENYFCVTLAYRFTPGMPEPLSVILSA